LLPGDTIDAQQDYSGNFVEELSLNYQSVNFRSYHVVLIAQCTNTFENCQLVVDHAGFSVNDQHKPATVAI
jgi:hypothetical protein